MKPTKMTKKTKSTILFWLRIAVQLGFFIFLPALFSQSYAGLKEIVTSIGGAKPLDFSSVFIIRLIVLCLLTVLAGRVFCGWACAFGAVGDWIYSFTGFILKKLGIKRKILPEKISVQLRKLKYFVLMGTLILCFFQLGRYVSEYSPWTSFSLITSFNLNPAEHIISVVILVGIVIGMASTERFFCRFLCPMGAVFSLLPELPFLSIKRNAAGCIKGCSACKRNCPVNLKLNEDPSVDGECIRCGKCMNTCPKKNLSFFRRSAVSGSSDSLLTSSLLDD